MAESGSFSGLISKFLSNTWTTGMDISKTHPIGQEPGVFNDNAYFCGLLNSGSVVYSEFSFDLSGIPTNAEINTVTVVAGGSCQTSYFSSYVAQLYCGSTAKGDTGSLRSTTTTYTTSFNGGVWTRDELNDCRIRFTATKSGSGSTRKCFISGARITVQYTVNNEKFMLKLGGAWHDIARVFKKVSGIWVEQEELANVVDQTKRLVNGGEIESTAPQTRTVVISGTGTTSNTSVECYVEINGIKYASATTVEVQPGTTMRCYGYGGTVSITLDGAQVGTAVDGNSSKQEYIHTVNGNCAVNLAYTTGFASSSTITITTGGGSSANLISFTIAGTSYQAEEGMTWAEWVASSYNTGGYMVSGSYVTAGAGKQVKKSSTANVISTQTIVSGYAYVHG